MIHMYRNDHSIYVCMYVYVFWCYPFRNTYIGSENIYTKNQNIHDRGREYFHLEVADSILTSGLMELEEFIPVDLIKGSVQRLVWAPEFYIKHLKKAEGHISQNIVSITMKI